MRIALISVLAFLSLAGLARAETDPSIVPDTALPGVEGPVPLPALPSLGDPPAAGPKDAPVPDPAKAAAKAEAEAEAKLSPSERLDKLFGDLRRLSDVDEAGKIASRIEKEWSDSGSATIDLLILWSGEAMAKENKAAALDLLGEAIALKPDYAESWNRRATLHFLASDFSKSIYDIEQTLRLEPRHFGALMGLGAILEQMDRKPEALDIYMRVLAVYPAMKSAQDAVGRLSEELAGQPT